MKKSEIRLKSENIYPCFRGRVMEWTSLYSEINTKQGGVGGGVGGEGGEGGWGGWGGGGGPPP